MREVIRSGEGEKAVDFGGRLDVCRYYPVDETRLSDRSGYGLCHDPSRGLRPYHLSGRAPDSTVFCHNHGPHCAADPAVASLRWSSYHLPRASRMGASYAETLDGRLSNSERPHEVFCAIRRRWAPPTHV